MRMLPSVNAAAAPLVAELKARADALRVGVTRMDDGTCVVDAGIDDQGGIEAGLLIARICMGGLGHVALGSNPVFPDWPWQVEVRTSQPVLACLGAQYAGWSLSFETPKKFSALGSGPARALAVREPLFEELGYRDRSDSACLVLETDRHPPAALAEKVSRDCGVAPERMTLVLTPYRQPRRRGPDSGAGGRGGAAQGSRDRLPPRRDHGRSGQRPVAAAHRRCARQRWDGPTTPFCSVARSSSSCPARTGRPRTSRIGFPAAARRTTASRSRRCSGTAATTSSGSTRCCSVRPGCR